MHTGTAEYGHYYSYININRGDKENSADDSKDKWLEFNDSLIRNYDPSKIAGDCFGGKSSSNYTVNSTGFSTANDMEKSKNAYILVYDKVVKNKVPLVYKNKE